MKYSEIYLLFVKKQEGASTSSPIAHAFMPIQFGDSRGEWSSNRLLYHQSCNY